MTLLNKATSDSLSQARILVNPEGSETIYEMMQFSQAVKVGTMVWVSGQVGVNEDFTIAEGIEAQSRKAFINLQKVIETSGGTLSDIVEIVTYHTSMKDMEGFSNVKAEFFTRNYPAWTAVGVSELVMPELLIEIRATAIIDSHL